MPRSSLPGSPCPSTSAWPPHIASVLEGHPDNASASVYGGLTVSWMPDGSGADLGEVTVTARPVLHPDVEVVVFVPDQQLATPHARAVLPEAVPPGTPPPTAVGQRSSSTP